MSPDRICGQTVPRHALLTEGFNGEGVEDGEGDVEAAGDAEESDLVKNSSQSSRRVYDEYEVVLAPLWVSLTCEN